MVGRPGPERVPGLSKPPREPNAMPTRRPLLSKPWTSDDDAKLLKLLRQGKHVTVIAASLRRTPGAVRSRIGKGGLAERLEPDSGTGTSA